MLAARDAIS